ncbi:MAG: proton-conducting transporter membrane subunit [Armatimonadota bacterium]|nr:proton-conducting transporter membrane subunit [Armatimonadota bacterium]MDR7569135.1 proton-conducting transporter membrane subunit [Armatimonadota bacterium]MDR7613419.1 proton-conducting transporter membrane subunit [Armatimonadota bacterium]
MNLAIVPVILPLSTGAACAAVESERARRWISLTGALGTLGAAAWLVWAVRGGNVVVLRAGGWPAPYGITFAVDGLGALMCGISSYVATVTLWFGMREAASRYHRYWHAGWHLLLGGMNGAFLTGDLFNLYVFFEILLIASYFLLTLGTSREQAREAFTYVALNLVASTLFLVAVGLLYAATGTVNMADLARRLPSAPSALVRGGVVLLATAFGLKAAIFPLYFWLPHAYAIPPGSVAAYFGGMLTKVGVYALYRLFTTLAPLGRPDPLWLFVASGTMVFGVLGALAQEEIRRILSFHIISQIGYMILGLALGTREGLAAGLFYVLHHIGVKTALLLASGTVERTWGTGRLSLLSGLGSAQPALGVLFFIPALSLAGIPPLSGFWGKVALLVAGADAYAERPGLWIPLALGTSVLVSLLTLASMVKIFTQAFWGPAPRRRRAAPELLLPVAAMAALTVVWGLGGRWLWELTWSAAGQLLDRGSYLDAVLGGSR